MRQLTRIVAAVVDTKKAILYKEDGTAIEIFQGDVRLRPILEYITPLLIKQNYADIDLSTPNSFKEFEQASSGFRFFKIAKAKFNELFHGKNNPIDPTVIGLVPIESVVASRQAAVQEIIAHATPVTAATFSEEGVAPQRPTAVDGHTPNDSRPNDGQDGHYDKHPDTIIAVTPKGRVIPGAERIKSQFDGAVKSGSTRGMEIFLERIGRVIDKRKHTVDDLLRFMERGDLPVADDGTIIIYKKLYRRDEHYVDAHSKNVKQRVGSFVHMDEKMVDPNRRNECSNGLHVARRGYVGSFSGDVIVLAKVRPEDVIAVPDYDANKMRVCGYHIIAELDKAQYQAINSNRPISAAEGGNKLLSRAIAGDHIGVIEHVKITQNNGGGLEITPKGEAAPTVPTPKTASKRPNSSKKAKKKIPAKKAKPKTKRTVKPLEATQAATDSHVDVKKVVAKTKDTTKSLSEDAPKQITQTDVVTQMWNKAIGGDKKKAKELLDFKKKAKKSWTVWNLPNTAGDTLKALLDP